VLWPWRVVGFAEVGVGVVTYILRGVEPAVGSLHVCAHYSRPAVPPGSQGCLLSSMQSLAVGECGVRFGEKVSNGPLMLMNR
jgi:hypothetical protein